MTTTNPASIPGNWFSELALTQHDRVTDMPAESAVKPWAGALAMAGAILANVDATLALSHEQHQRNRLAAITAAHRGIVLPPDLAALATEGTDPTPATTGHDTKEKNA